MTRLIMISSASYYAMLGLLLTFLPQEIYQWLDVKSENFHYLVAQALGASFLALAILNWYTRNNILGGIYGKPLTLANFLYFFVTLMTGLKADGGPLIYMLTTICGIFAAFFGYITFTHPFKN